MWEQDHPDVVHFEVYNEGHASLVKAALKPVLMLHTFVDSVHLELDVQIFLLVVWAESVC